MIDDEAVLISVIIPVRNGDYWLENTLRALTNQTLSDVTEIIILDSGSTDNSLEIVKKFSANIINIEPKSFNHGLTRNEGVRHSRGKYIVMTVQDAEPTDKYWLQNLLEGFIDESIAGVCGQQIVPHEIDKNPIEWFRPQEAGEIRKYLFSSEEEFLKLSPSLKRLICGWDNVNAMYRKDKLIEIPFKETSFAEDALWAKDVLLTGRGIVYNPKAQVKHYHVATYDFTLRRTFTIDYHFYAFFDYLPKAELPGIITFLKDIKILISEKVITWSKKAQWLYFNYRRRKAIYDAHVKFLNALKNNNLDNEHLRICSASPQAIKPKK